jgi:hypothetical protein
MRSRQQLRRTLVKDIVAGVAGATREAVLTIRKRETRYLTVGTLTNSNTWVPGP